MAMETLTLNTLNKPRLNRIKILVIEDDPETAEVVRILLSMNGYQPIIESGSLDILGLLKYTRPDLVIIDYLLPFINGGELCASIKNDNDWKHLPVIIYSAYSRVINSLGNYHCDAFLPKPFDLNELLSLVKTHLFKYELLSHN
jgi:DNA-binding response OmpR family regulator